MSLESLVGGADDASGLRKMKMLLGGATGSGKSTFAAKFARPFFLLSEPQAIPNILSINPEAKFFRNREARVCIRDYDDLQLARQLIREPWFGERFDAVVLDSLQDVQRVIKHHWEGRARSKGKTLNQQTWGYIIDETSRIIREIRDVNCHAIVTCIFEEERDEEKVLLRPAISGKIKYKIGEYFNCIGVMSRARVGKGIRRHVIFDGPERIMTKPLPGLDAIEPPEPLYLAHKLFGEDLPDEVSQAVAAWSREGKEEN